MRCLWVLLAVGAAARLRSLQEVELISEEQQFQEETGERQALDEVPPPDAALATPAAAETLAAVETPAAAVETPAAEATPVAAEEGAVEGAVVEDSSALEALTDEAQTLVVKLKQALATESDLLAQLADKLATLSGEDVPAPVDTAVDAEGSSSLDAATPENRELYAATWNMAAINNNPFEYWVTYEGAEGEAYMELMDKVSTILSREPADDEVVTAVFTEDMFEELIQAMTAMGMAEDDTMDEVRDYWADDLSKRTIVNGFLKDPTLGAKRLVSMPDRVTNTIRLADGTVATRPTVINCYAGDLPDRESWWAAWKMFMFGERLNVPNNDEPLPPAKMLVPVSRVKYPEVTPHEEAISVPLTAVTVAIFDAILMQILTETAVDWQPIRKNMCGALNEQKNPRTAEILEQDALYGTKLDVLFLQESSQSFADLALTRRLGMELMDVHVPGNRDPSRDQNSLILTKKGAWTDPQDVSEEVAARLAEDHGGDSPIAPGDLAVFKVTRVLDGKPYLLASFHGDTNGLATKDVVDVIHSYHKHDAKDASLLFGLDANTHFDDSTPAKLAYVGDFLQNVDYHGMESCYGLDPAVLQHTTFNARTYLQPQLNKAVRADEKDTSPMVDKNPKDFILFYADDFAVQGHTMKDNTGTGDFDADIVFPTFDFPSDHAISRVTLVAAAQGNPAPIVGAE